jgi:hypothetical protein
MAHSLGKLLKLLVLPLAGALVLGIAGAAYAQSSVAQDTVSRTPAAQNRQLSGADTGRRAVPRNGAPLPASAAPVALALENAGPPPASTPEPITLALVGGALAGLYGMRKHLS